MNYTIHNPAWVLTVLVPMESSTTITIQVFCHAGSIYESRETNGLSHFLEHMFFKWWVRYPDAESISKTLDAIGAEHNAYTSDYFASYYVKSAPEYWNTDLDVLSDMICNAHFPHKEVDKERWVILQELQMYKDQPKNRMSRNAKRRYQWDNAYGWPIIGNEETIQAVSRDSLLHHKQSLYTKDNLIVVIAWNIQDPEEILGAVAEQFAWLWKTTTLQKAPYTFSRPMESSSYLKQWVNQSHAILFAEWVTLGNDRAVCAAKLLANALGGTTSSRLWMEIRERLGLCYYVGATHTSGPDFGQFNIVAGLDKLQLERWLEAIYTILQLVAQGELSREEFELSKSNYLGTLQMGLETSDAIADRVGHRYMMRNDIMTLDQVLEQYEQVDYEDLLALCGLLHRQNLYTYRIE